MLQNGLFDNASDFQLLTVTVTVTMKWPIFYFMKKNVSDDFKYVC